LHTNPHTPRDARTRGNGSYPDLLTVLIGGALFCVLLCLLLRHLFPAPLWRDEEMATRDGTSATARELSHATPGVTTTSHVAMLLSLSGDVKVRYADSLGWGDAQARLELHADDAIQTFTRSSALLRLETKAFLELGERSLIVFSAAAVDPFAGSTARRGTLLEGMLAGTLGGARGDGTPFELALPGAQLTLQPETAAEGEVRFQVNRNPDASTSIALYSGRARLSGGVAPEIIASGFGVTLDGNGAVLDRRALPDAPAVLGPVDNGIVTYRDVPPRVIFTWNPVRKVTRYRLRVARDPDLREILLDERIAADAFALSDLHAGDAWWSVSAVDGWLEGPGSEPRRLMIRQDSDAPVLTLEPLSESAVSGPIVVRGHTEAGARVHVQGEVVEPDANGDFEAELARRGGAFLLVVEASDAVGNTSYQSQIVTARDTERAAVADTETAP
jgi:hypothetical protein